MFQHHANKQINGGK